MKEENIKTPLEQAEEALHKFWLEKSKAPIIKAKHTELFVEPKVFVGGELNPEIGKLVIQEYLSRVRVEDIAKGSIVISSDLIKINDENGKLIAEVRSKRIINSMINKITDYLGRELAAKQSKDGDPYVAPKDGNYAFGDIKDALIEFLHDMERNDSKNLVRDAIILLRQNNTTQHKIHAVQPAKPVEQKAQKTIPPKK